MVAFLVGDASARDMPRKHSSGTDVRSWDAAPFLDAKTGAFKPLPLNVIEPDNEVKATEYKPFYCLKWHDGCTECQRESVTAPVTCGPLEIGGSRVCEPQKVACKRIDGSLLDTYCRTISLGTEVLTQELYQAGKRFVLGEQVDPYERHFNRGAYEYVGLTSQQAEVLRKRYGSSYFDATYCLEARSRVYKR
jgi:hypothetical protein